MLFGWGRKKTDCDWAQPLLSSYLDNQISVEDRRRLEAHLRGCASCSEELASLKLTVGLLRRVPAVPVPRSFTLSVPEAARRPVLSPAFFYLRNATAVMAAVFVVLIAGGFALEALQPVYMTGAPAQRGSEGQVALRQDHEQLTEKAQFGAAPAEDTQRAAFSNATTPEPAPEPTMAAAATPLAPAPVATQPESGDAAGRAAPGPPPQPAAGLAPTGSAVATAEPPTEPGAAESTRKIVVPTSGQPPAAATPGDTVAAGPAAGTMPAESAPVASYPLPGSRTGESGLRMAQLAVGGVLALLVAGTGAIWLRDRRRRGY